ncbi:HSF-type DNA-binding-domain-containing protein [Terfezia claveryi]|nr:HSF-type DNA-binding-domain-containing protein [Terfezia claveryi]
MLEDPTYRHIVRWNDQGNSFIVLDNTEFTKNVLPRHFKHSNFASFVRQLNKYDFHKIRNTDEHGGSQYGEQAWEFKHPNFLMHSRDQLENIRRKVPAARKPAQKAASEDQAALQAAFTQIEELQGHLQQLRDAQKGIDHQLERNDTMCQALVAQVGNMHKKLMGYEDLIQRLMVELAQKEVELRDIGRRNPHLVGLQVTEYNEYSERNESGGNGEEKNEGGNNEGSDWDEDDEDEYDDMDEDMDEDMVENNGEDGSEEHLPTSISVPSQELTPFIMEHSTPLGQNYDQTERQTSASGATTLGIDEIGPFDPGGVSNNHTPDEQQTMNMFDHLLSKSTRDNQSWLKLPGLNPKIQSQVKSSDGLSVVLFSPAAASSHSSATPPSGSIEESAMNGLAETADDRMYNVAGGNDEDSIQKATRSRLAASVPPQVSVNSEKDGITINGHAGIYLPPITEVGSLSTGPSLHTLSQIKQSLDAANVDKGKGKEITGTPLERRPPPSRHYTAPILVVDDDPMCRRLLMLFFSYNKQEVDCASDGISAVEKANRHKYSIIFMDVILPLLDGVSATKLMRKTDKETPIVCLASTTNDVDLDRYKRSGMNIILSKPFGFKKLYEAMLEIMPESTGWAIPRGLRAKRNKGNNQQRAVTNESSGDGQESKSNDLAIFSGSTDSSKFTGTVGNGRTDTTGETMVDIGDQQNSDSAANHQASAPLGPFCLRPMSIANIINGKNDDPKKREHTEMESQNETGIGEGADAKKRRVTLENVAPEVSSLLDMEISPPYIDTNPVNDYDISLTLEIPSPLPVL